MLVIIGDGDLNSVAVTEKGVSEEWKRGLYTPAQQCVACTLEENSWKAHKMFPPASFPCLLQKDQALELLFKNNGGELCLPGEPPPECVALCMQGDTAALLHWRLCGRKGKTLNWPAWQPSLDLLFNNCQEERTVFNQ